MRHPTPANTGTSCGGTPPKETIMSQDPSNMAAALRDALEHNRSVRAELTAKSVVNRFTGRTAVDAEIDGDQPHRLRFLARCPSCAGHGFQEVGARRSACGDCGASGTLFTRLGEGLVELLAHALAPAVAPGAEPEALEAWNKARALRSKGA